MGEHISLKYTWQTLVFIDEYILCTKLIQSTKTKINNKCNKGIHISSYNVKHTGDIQTLARKM